MDSTTATAFEVLRGTFRAELGYQYVYLRRRELPDLVRIECRGPAWEHHVDLYTDVLAERLGSSAVSVADQLADVARECWRVWWVNYVPVVVTDWNVDADGDDVSRRFASRLDLLEELIEVDRAAAHSGVLLTEILAEDYAGDRVAMALAIGTGAFEPYTVELAQ